MADTELRAGLVGAGYIADWHAAAIAASPGARLVAVADRAAHAAEALAERHGARAYADVAEMLARGGCDIVHVLTPPASHAALARQCLRAGTHVLVEKPVALSASEVAEIEAEAQASGRVFAAGHNFLGLPSYERLKSALAEGLIGPVDTAELTWALPFPPLRSGPYGLWPLQAPENQLLETGPHLLAFATDLFGPVEIEHLSLGRPVELPGMGRRPQLWRMTGQAGGVALSLTISSVETWDERSLTLRGPAGFARLDYAGDTLLLRRENASDLILNPLRKELSTGWQHLRGGTARALRELSSLNRASPYALSFRGMLAEVYGAIRAGRAPDVRFAGRSAVPVMRAVEQACARIPAEWRPPAPPVRTRKPAPQVMVIGGTGFIGRNLTRALAARGTDVRVVSRGGRGPFDDLPDRVETVAVPLRDRAALAEAMRGVDCVVNLARSADPTWQNALENDVRVTVTIAEAALDAGVRRLIYTGTIASYDMSDPAATITEATGFAPDMSDRNVYARSKAECERRMMEMHLTRDLPMLIARPGIVIGPGGPLQHWGIGRWHGSGAVRLWGDGRNKLPFVLIEDVTDALIRMMDDDIPTGESFNLVGPPLLSGREYFEAIRTELGAALTVRPGNLTAMWAGDAVKHVLKRHVLRRRGLVRPSLKDWKSRAHLSRFDNTHPRRLLGWTPVDERESLIRRGIVEANLLGF
ncbi:oxidoreductase [Rhodosalinus halophilus]|uniref:Oxidoreductase n=1 Tax=Rhodosalinus halophilus TaxID=2259333 RepID=A0A365U9N0_9RHOB|nr:NAD-dependent epimerase/dehydratase family protein [Rhodosalinus halophilus]RBI85441.1 oxidoreductase [Rhodosalinus halophilus]